MSTQKSPALEQGSDLEPVERVLAPDGTRLSNQRLDRYLHDVTVEQLRDFWRDMTIIRRIDAEGMALQRQGQLGLWAPSRGQEAAQLGTARALRETDFIFPSYREHGVLYARGAASGDYLRVWRGEEGAAYDPAALNMAPMQIIIGAQTLHATGFAVGIRHESTDEVVATYFGDGATSQGDLNEAMIFASSYRAPVIFVCQNNHWAISEPVTVQAKHPIAGRAPGFGIPSIRVDGNDVLACFAAMRWAAEHARAGDGPVFLELVTYRMGPHTTADDPTRYRTEEEVAMWEKRDPIARLEAYLRERGELSEQHRADGEAAADAAAKELRATCLAMVTREPLTVFDEVYAEPHSGLRRQREQYAAYLATFEEA